MFTEIIHISLEDNKTNYIEPEKAIFVDNAYKERKLVHDKFNIPVFDVEGIEVLTNWRN